MPGTRVKLLQWVALATVLGCVLLAIASGLLNLKAYVQRSADPAAFLEIVPNAQPELHTSVTWLPDAPDTGRTMEPFTREQIEQAYLRAWLQLNISYLRNEPYGLKTYFAGPSLDAVSAAVHQVAGQRLRVAQGNSAHQLQLNLYSADGSIVSFTDRRALIGYSIWDASGAEVSAGESAAVYDVVMMQEDGNWRVRHWVRQDILPLDNALPSRSVSAPAGFVERIGQRLVLDGKPFYVAGINYYPQATPWLEFWPSYDPATTDRDFDLIRSLGLNTVRIFIPYEKFGGPNVDPVLVEKLADLLTRADVRGLKVIVTLFDFRSDYRPLVWAEGDRHLETLLTRFADNRAILAWDLKNEPNLDYLTNGHATVDAWLGHVARLARSYAPNHLLTIGWGSPEAAQAMADSVDFVSFHYYAPATELPVRYSRLRATVPDQPIVLGEFGLSTWNSFFFPNGHSEPEQAQYYADILRGMRTSDSGGYLAWTLFDFDRVPAAVAGSRHWQTEPRRHLGVIRRDGQAKPSASLLAPEAPLTVTRIPGWARFLKPFWLTTMVVTATTIILLVRGPRWWRRRRARRKQTPTPQ